ncbi:MAG: AraC family transcriptional regulator ligand-binding domain-containing protein [Endozoicomonas sp.]|uniref:AraC family transcriptional regulator ligand-binding domain-containing protein n=1 Tax=Endozoicomonas sp. TaxID=1892382 RepID=UPI003D9B6F7A
MASLSGKAITPLTVNLMGPPMFSLSEYRYHFECPIRFDQPENSILIASEELSAPIVQTQEHFKHLTKGNLYSFFNTETLDILPALKNGDSYS